MTAAATVLKTLDPVLYFSPEMLTEIALGAEHPHDIAAKYGMSDLDYEQLTSLPWYAEMVARKRQELADNGFLFQTKSAMMAEALLTHLFRQAISSKMAIPQAIDLSKQLIEVGRLKPQPNAPGAGGPGGPAFQINIQVNGDTKTLDVDPAGAAPAAQAGGSAPALTVDFSPVDNPPILPAILPPPPPVVPPPLAQPPAYISNLRPPNFDRDATVQRGYSALTGNPIAQAAATTSPSTPPPVSPSHPGTAVGLPPKSPLG